MARRRRLADELARVRPELEDPDAEIAAGRVFVDGVPVTNPASMVRPGAAIVVRPATELRGSAKLRAALDAFGVSPSGRVCVDVGAAAGGFTTVLLERGAARVYAVDAGHGQLLGSLRQDGRVVDLEATNLAEAGPDVIPEPVELIVVDLSYLALAEAIPQLRVRRHADADLIALVKPMFELHLATAPTDPDVLPAAVAAARPGIEGAGWVVAGWVPSPVAGAKGAVEALLHARPSP